MRPHGISPSYQKKAALLLPFYCFNYRSMVFTLLRSIKTIQIPDSPIASVLSDFFQKNLHRFLRHGFHVHMIRSKLLCKRMPIEIFIISCHRNILRYPVTGGGQVIAADKGRWHSLRKHKAGFFLHQPGIINYPIRS